MKIAEGKIGLDGRATDIDDAFYANKGGLLGEHQGVGNTHQ